MTQGSVEKRLAGKTALITGSSKGIGQGIAIELARQGADVAINYVRDEAGAAQTVAQARALGVRAEAFRCDLAEREQIIDMVQRVQTSLGGPDIIVSNSTEVFSKPLMQVTADEWQRTLNVTCSALLYLAQAAAPIMRERGAGWIIPITSRGAYRVVPNYGALGVPKAAMDALMKYLAAELRPQGIRINAVSPGIVDTAAVRTIFGSAAASAERVAQIGASVPARRNAMPDDIGRLVAFLCTPEADLIVGQILMQDGGSSLS